MRTSIKIAIIVAAVLVASGVVTLIVAAIASGFNPSRLSSIACVETSYDVTDSFESISVSSDSADIYVLPATDGRCRVVFYDIDDPTAQHTVEVANGGLMVVRRLSMTPFNVINFSGTPRVTVYLPGESYRDMRLEASSGAVTAECDNISFGSASLKTASGRLMATELRVTANMGVATSSGAVTVRDCEAAELDVHSTSGRIELERTVCTDAELESSSGVIRVSELTAAGEVDVTSTSGSQRLVGIRCSKLDLKASSGSVRAEDTIATAELEAETTSGSIRLERCDAAELELESTSGSIGGSLLSDKIYLASSSSGSIRVPDTREGGFCHIRTTSGSIHFD